MAAAAPMAFAIADFRELAVIGRGQYGSCSLAEHLPSGERVVLKAVPLDGLDGELAGAATQEVALLSRLRHPAIVRCFGSFAHDNVLYIVMEYCEKGDLERAIKAARAARRHFSEEQIIDWFAQLLSAVAFCHKAGVLHRDIKATNVFLTKNNMVRLGDFGISKVLDEGAAAHTTIGTPYYMSPEICEGRPYSASSDMWSLGCVLYEMCALLHAFRGPNILALVHAIVHDPSPRVSERYSPGLRGLVANLLMKDAAERMSADAVLFLPVVTRRLLVLAQSDETTAGLRTPVMTAEGSTEYSNPSSPIVAAAATVVDAVTRSATAASASFAERIDTTADDDRPARASPPAFVVASAAAAAAVLVQPLATVPEFDHSAPIAKPAHAAPPAAAAASHEPVVQSRLHRRQSHTGPAPPLSTAAISAPSSGRGAFSPTLTRESLTIEAPLSPQRFVPDDVATGRRSSVVQGTFTHGVPEPQRSVHATPAPVRMKRSSVVQLNPDAATAISLAAPPAALLSPPLAAREHATPAGVQPLPALKPIQIPPLRDTPSSRRSSTSSRQSGSVTSYSALQYGADVSGIDVAPAVGHHGRYSGAGTGSRSVTIEDTAAVAPVPFTVSPRKAAHAPGGIRLQRLSAVSIVHAARVETDDSQSTPRFVGAPDVVSDHDEATHTPSTFRSMPSAARSPMEWPSRDSGYRWGHERTGIEAIADGHGHAAGSPHSSSTSGVMLAPDFAANSGMHVHRVQRHKRSSSHTLVSSSRSSVDNFDGGDCRPAAAAVSPLGSPVACMAVSAGHYPLSLMATDSHADSYAYGVQAPESPGSAWRGGVHAHYSLGHDALAAVPLAGHHVAHHESPPKHQHRRISSLPSSAVSAAHEPFLGHGAAMDHGGAVGDATVGEPVADRGIDVVTDHDAGINRGICMTPGRMLGHRTCADGTLSPRRPAPLAGSTHSPQGSLTFGRSSWATDDRTATEHAASPGSDETKGAFAPSTHVSPAARLLPLSSRVLSPAAHPPATSAPTTDDAAAAAAPVPRVSSTPTVSPGTRKKSQAWALLASSALGKVGRESATAAAAKTPAPAAASPLLDNPESAHLRAMKALAQAVLATVYMQERVAQRRGSIESPSKGARAAAPAIAAAAAAAHTTRAARLDHVDVAATAASVATAAASPQPSYAPFVLSPSPSSSGDKGFSAGSPSNSRVYSHARTQRRKLQLQMQVGESFDDVYASALRIVQCTAPADVPPQRAALLAATSRLPCCSAPESLDANGLLAELESIARMEHVLGSRRVASSATTSAW